MFFSGIADEAGLSINEQIRAHQEIGFDHIEIRNVDGINLTDLCDEAFEDVYEKVTAAGLDVSCFASQLCNWARKIAKHPDIDRHELERAIPRMQRFGCRFIRAMSYPNAGWPEEAWRDEVVKRLKALAAMAEDGGIVLVHENCDGWGGVNQTHTLELLDRVGSDALKLVWDTGNPVAHKGQDAWEYYQAVRDHVVYCHIKDIRIEDGKEVYTFPGEGEGKVREVIADMLARGYDGGFSIEPHMAAVVHEGKQAGADAFGVYVEYGRRARKLVEELK